MTRRVLKAELDGERMTIREAVRRMILAGRDNEEIHLELEKFSTRNTVAVGITEMWKELKRPAPQSRSFAIGLDVKTRRAFEREAESRGVTMFWLLSMSLRIIAADNLFEAVIGDELPPRRDEDAP